MFILTFKALSVGLTRGSGRTWGQLTPPDLLTALSRCIGWAAAREIVPHGVTHTSIQAGIILQQILTITHHSTVILNNKDTFTIKS